MVEIKNFNINSGSMLRIEGSLTVYGNFNLNSGATLEFVRENSFGTETEYW